MEFGFRKKKKATAASAPKAISCPLCNKKFFKASFPIHYKQCQELHKVTHDECPNCGRMVHKDDIPTHEKLCTEEKPMQMQMNIKRRSKIKAMTADDIIDAQLHSDASQSSSVASSEIGLAVGSGQPSMMTMESMEDQNDYRVSCQFCERKFNPDRIEKHQSICSKVRPENRSIKKKITTTSTKPTETPSAPRTKLQQKKQQRVRPALPLKEKDADFVQFKVTKIEKDLIQKMRKLSKEQREAISNMVASMNKV